MSAASRASCVFCFGPGLSDVAPAFRCSGFSRASQELSQTILLCISSTQMPVFSSLIQNGIGIISSWPKGQNRPFLEMGGRRQACKCSGSVGFFGHFWVAMALLLRGRPIRIKARAAFFFMSCAVCWRYVKIATLLLRQFPSSPPSPAGSGKGKAVGPTIWPGHVHQPRSPRRWRAPCGGSAGVFFAPSIATKNTESRPSRRNCGCGWPIWRDNEQEPTMHAAGKTVSAAHR